MLKTSGNKVISFYATVQSLVSFMCKVLSFVLQVVICSVSFCENVFERAVFAAWINNM
jgi:hypothetical protein